MSTLREQATECGALALDLLRQVLRCVILVALWVALRMLGE